MSLRNLSLAAKINIGQPTTRVFKLSVINYLHLSSRVQTLINLNFLAKFKPTFVIMEKNRVMV